MLIQIPNPVQAEESDSPQQKQAILWAPAGWLRIQLSSDTVCKEIVSDSTGQGFCSMRLYSLWGFREQLQTQVITCDSSDLSLNFRHQSQVQVVKCISNLLAINQVPMTLF